MTRNLTPLIGITADTTGGVEDPQANSERRLFLFDRYVAAVEAAGGAPLILPIAASKRVLRRYFDGIDGLLISGGNFDIHPHFYGESAIDRLGRLLPDRTEFEFDLIRLALGRDLPILGICGGAQAINVVLGGSLYQDIAAQCPGARAHRGQNGKTAGCHRVEVAGESRLRRIVRRQSLEVNTSHHQAVKRPGDGLAVNAVAEDGIIEGIESTRHSFVMGVQWHPEVPVPRQECQRRLMRAFVSSCRREARPSRVSPEP